MVLNRVLGFDTAWFFASFRSTQKDVPKRLPMHSAVKVVCSWLSIKASACSFQPLVFQVKDLHAAEAFHSEK